jgi:hypothetical protein
MISLPNWSLGRLLRESVTDFNLRHPDYLLDAKSGEWPVLYNVVNAFLRHRLTNYEEQLATARYNPALRGELVSKIERVACRKYPWLRLDYTSGSSGSGRRAVHIRTNLSRLQNSKNT